MLNKRQESWVWQQIRRACIEAETCAKKAGWLKESELNAIADAYTHAIAEKLAEGIGENLLWSGKAELHNGMLCGYQGDPKERIQAPDQIVTVYVERKRNGARDE